MPDEFSIEDLEKHSGLSTRNLYYYMQIGLLPGPETRGKYASYSQEHLDRLDLILILKEMHLPLKEIRAVLNRLTPSEIVRYRDDQEELLDKIKGVKPDMKTEKQHQKENSALDYIKGLDEAFHLRNDIKDNQPYFYFSKQSNDKMLFSNKSQIEFEKPQVWRRIILGDGIELQIRDTRDKEVLYKVERLLTFARALFSDNQEEKTDEQ
jgi:DNA-binding transcriptional MerR regulator